MAEIIVANRATVPPKNVPQVRIPARAQAVHACVADVIVIDGGAEAPAKVSEIVLPDA